MHVSSDSLRPVADYRNGLLNSRERRERRDVEAKC